MKRLITAAILSVIVLSCSEDSPKPDRTSDLRGVYEKFISREISNGTDFSKLHDLTVNFMLANGATTSDRQTALENSAKEAPESGQTGGVPQNGNCVITRNSKSFNFPDGTYCYVYTYSDGCTTCPGGFSVSWWGKGMVDLGENFNCPSGNYFVPPLGKN